MSGDRFDLHRLIRDVLARGEAGADPQTIAKAIMREIPPKAYGEALAQAMPGLVQHAMSRTRLGTTVVINPEAREDVGAAEPARKPAARKPGRAYNQEAVREHWRKAMLDRECIDGHWKRYGQLTIDDLHWLRDARYEAASQFTAKGDWYQHVAGLLAKHGVETVEELPESVLAATFRRRRDVQVDAA